MNTRDIEKKTNLMVKALDWAYNNSINGFQTFVSAQNLGQSYLKNNNYNKLDAINSLIRWQNSKAATSGFLSNMGGLITLPLAVPANIASVIYIQLRMVTAIACINKFDPKQDEVRTLCYTCLTGSSISEIFKKAGVQITQKLTISTIQKYITREMLKTINQAVGFRLITKAGSTGIINLTKIVPFVGGIVGGSFDAFTTNTIGNFARDMFYNQDPSLIISNNENNSTMIMKK